MEDTADLLKYLDFLNKGDPLVIHDADDKPKTEQIKLGIKAI